MNIEPAGAAKPREGADRGCDGSLLPEKTRAATEAADRRDAAVGFISGTETETETGANPLQSKRASADRIVDPELNHPVMRSQGPSIRRSRHLGHRPGGWNDFLVNSKPHPAQEAERT